jgi:hypothetical protein
MKHKAVLPGNERGKNTIRALPFAQTSSDSCCGVNDHQCYRLRELPIKLSSSAWQVTTASTRVSRPASGASDFSRMMTCHLTTLWRASGRRDGRQSMTRTTPIISRATSGTLLPIKLSERPPACRNASANLPHRSASIFARSFSSHVKFQQNL